MAGKGFLLGWYSLSAPEQYGIGTNRPLSAGWRKILFRERLQSVSTNENRLICRANVDRTLRVFGVAKLPAVPSKFSFFRMMLRIALAVSSLLFFWIAWFQELPTLPNRLQLSFLFGLIGATGIITLLSVGYTYRSARESTLIRESHERALKVLEKADNSFFPSLTPLAERYRKLVVQFEKKPDQVAKMLSPLDDDQKKGIIRVAFLIDASAVTIRKAIFSPKNVLRPRAETT